MKVRVVVECSDHRRRYAADEVVDFDDEQAGRWVAQGLAVAVAEHVAHAEPPEATTLEPEENTALPRARKRKA